MIISNFDFRARKELEEAILGALLIDTRISTKELLLKHGVDTKEYFCIEFHQDLFERIWKCINAGLKVDLITIGNFKQEKYIDKPNTFDFEAISLTQKISSSAHLEYHLMILKQYILMDYWNNRATDILDGSWRTRDVLQVSDNIINGYTMLLAKFTDNMEKTVLDSVHRDDLMKKWEDVQNGIPISVPSGIKKFDKDLGGWFNSEFSILAGRPGMGKTSLALFLAEKAAELGLLIHFYTLEMPKKQLQNRVIADELGIDKEDIRRMNLDFVTLQKVLDRYDYMDNKSNLKIIDDCKTITSIYRSIKEHKPKMVWIDYIQLIHFDSGNQMKVGNREQEVGAISRALKSMATEFDIPINALAQLGRAVDSRQNKRPMISDLRESGSLEQDADNVDFVYRDAYYAKLNNIVVPEEQTGNMEYIRSKGRETGLATFYINADFKSNTLYDYWFDHNNGDQFFENRRNKLQPVMAIAAPPPPPSKT